MIVPVYNVAPYVEACLQSVMGQTSMGEMECLVVDDCGTDGSMAIVERMLGAYTGPIHFRILRHTRNRGLSAARNTGILAASGEYLFFLDSDDTIAPDCIEKLVSVAGPAAEMVQGRFDINGDGLARPLGRMGQAIHAEGNAEARACLFRQRRIADTVWNKLVRRSFILEHDLLFREGVLHEDFMWKHDVLKCVGDIWLLPDITYHYRRRPGSIMTGTDKAVSGFYFCSIAREIAMRLSPGHEKEEVRFYGRQMVDLCLIYARHSPDIKDVMRLYRGLARKYRLYPLCGKLTLGYMVGKLRLGWILVPLMRRVKHPQLIPYDFRTLWRRVLNTCQSKA